MNDTIVTIGIDYWRTTWPLNSKKESLLNSYFLPFLNQLQKNLQNGVYWVKENPICCPQLKKGIPLGFL